MFVWRDFRENEKGGENEVLVSVWLEGREEKNVVRPGCFLPGPTKIFSP